MLSARSCARPAPRQAGARLALLPRYVLLGAISVYQNTLGPALPRACRFEPSCSRYAFTAIQRYGALGGSWRALRRLARCQPFGGSGYDPVP